MAITNKDFPAFVALMERTKAAIPEICGEVKEIHADWSMNGCLDIQVTLIQDAPTESLRNFHPGHYTIHLTWNPYHAGGIWEVHDYSRGQWEVPFEESDAWLKPHQTPYTWGFNDIPEVPGRKEWVGTPLLAGADYRIKSV